MRKRLFCLLCVKAWFKGKGQDKLQSRNFSQCIISLKLITAQAFGRYHEHTYKRTCFAFYLSMRKLLALPINWECRHAKCVWSSNYRYYYQEKQFDIRVTVVNAHIRIPHCYNGSAGGTREHEEAKRWHIGYLKREVWRSITTSLVLSPSTLNRGPYKPMNNGWRLHQF